MTTEPIFEAAEKYGWQDDFGRWNFKDEGLINFVLAIEGAEREACARIVEADADARGKGGGGLVLLKAAERIRARGEK
jgi:GNAT superfamily N-acetyltransferase